MRSQNMELHMKSPDQHFQQHNLTIVSSLIACADTSAEPAQFKPPTMAISSPDSINLLCHSTASITTLTFGASTNCYRRSAQLRWTGCS